MAALAARAAIAEGARVVVEHATRDPAPSIAGLLPTPSRAYGDTSLTIYLRSDG
jgi:hypothetical protein